VSETATTTSGRAEFSSFVQAWISSVSQVMGKIAGSTVAGAELPQVPAELAAASEQDLWAICACSGALRGEMSLRLSPGSALRAAQIFMSEPATPSAALTSQHREAVAGLLRQVGGLVASSLDPSWGEVQLRLDAAAGPPSWPASSTYWLRAGADESAAVFVEMHLSAALVAALRAERTEPAKAAVVAPPPAPAATSAEGKLALLMNVELAMTLRFGGRQLPLRDVLELSPGAVVELDRRVQEPVEVLLDGKLVARGEVVVIEGNYGLRVTEVVSPGAALDKELRQAT